MPVATRKSSSSNVICAVWLAALSYAAVIGLPAAAHAQTFAVLHTFTGGDGQAPEGVTVDQSGNVFGTTYYGGALQLCDLGCGTVFKVSHRNSNWIFGTL